MKSPFGRLAPVRPVEADPLVVVDVGARWGIGERWAPLAPARRVYGFDPDPEECARLNAKSLAEGDSTVSYVPVALGRRNGRAKLHSTVEPACSSLYPPISALVDRIPVLKSIAPAGVIDIDLRTLDSWCREQDVRYVDMLKLDTQGSELGVLQGAERVLSTVQVLEIEVEFNPIYEGQPLFGDVDAHLRARGFSLWRLDELMHYSSGGAASDVDTTLTSHYDSPVGVQLTGRGGQLYWAHALYARTELCPGSERRPTAEQARRAAAVAGCLELPDLAASARAKAAG